jgi:DNA-binding CsgD family transcriptional regulator
VCDGIRAVLDGKKKIFCHEYPCHSPDKQRWFQMKVTPLLRSKPKEVVVIHVDITDRRLAEMESWAKQRELGAALAQLQSMAGRIKNSIGAEKFVRLIDAASPAHAQQSQPKVEAGLLKSLSKRELEVLIGLARGERNTDIATRLQLSKKSVSTYRSRVFEKLKVESNAQLATFVERSGLFDDGSA